MSENESYIRWQNIRISQLGFANNLIIALAVALIGFTIDFIQSDNLTLTCLQKILFWFGCLLIIVSIGIGLFVIFNRLEDFKLTAQIARKRKTENRAGIEVDRIKSDRIGKKTWNCFAWQVSTFIVAFLMLLILVLIELKDIII